MQSFNTEALLKEIEFRFTRSGGKGGQNVNKVATKAELYFDINKSTSLNDEQKQLLHIKLVSRISAAGILKVTSEEDRTQLGNKEKAAKKFLHLIKKAFAVKKKRIETKIPKAVKEKRLQNKKLKSVIKKLRSSPLD